MTGGRAKVVVARTGIVTGIEGLVVGYTGVATVDDLGRECCLAELLVSFVVVKYIGIGFGGTETD